IAAPLTGCVDIPTLIGVSRASPSPRASTQNASRIVRGTDGHCGTFAGGGALAHAVITRTIGSRTFIDAGYVSRRALPHESQLRRRFRFEERLHFTRGLARLDLAPRRLTRKPARQPQGVCEG